MLDGGQRACLLLMRGLSPAKHILTAKTRLITMRSQPNCFEVVLFFVVDVVVVVVVVDVVFVVVVVLNVDVVV